MQTEIMLRDKYTILKDIFGYSSFREIQEEIIDQTIKGKDSLVIMPTGGGKSLCFQIPAIVREGMALVVSPLIALMEDQVIALNLLGVKAEAIHSNHSKEKLTSIAQQIENKALDLLYVSPERFASPRFLSFLKDKPINLIAIDEAHCVSVWGNDFRPDYAALSALKDHFPTVPMIALTATADKATQEDIIEQLKLNDPGLFLSSFERENIFVEVRPGNQRKEQILSFLKQQTGEPGIIYCLSRKSTEKVAEDLVSSGFNAASYHAGMSPQARQEVQSKFQNDDIQIICATIAFGMGIDKSNIKWIVHYNMPKNLESYYQEIGRSGRDGSPAKALLFYSWADFLQYKKFIDSGNGNEDFRFIQNAKLNRIWEFVNSSDCRTNIVLNYFGEYKNKGCNHCDNCEFPPEKFNGIIEAQKAISAVIRSGEKLPMSLLIDVLRGSHRQEIIQNGLDKIKTFGAGRDLSFAEWREYLTQIIDKGYLMIDYKNNLRIRTTPLARSILEKNSRVLFKKYEPIQERESTKRIKEKKKTKTQLLEEDLTVKLKTWRHQKAQQMGMAPYQLISDLVLSRIVEHKPFYIEELRSIEGIGREAMHKYGIDLLEFLQGFFATQEHSNRLTGKTYLETLFHYKTGKSPEQIAEIKGVHLYTIYSHFAYLYLREEAIDLTPYITNEQVETVKKAISECEDDEELNLRKHLPEDFSIYLIRMAKSILSRN